MKFAASYKKTGEMSFIDPTISGTSVTCIRKVIIKLADFWLESFPFGWVNQNKVLNMISLGFDYKIIPEHKNDFIQATKDGLIKLRSLPGHVKSYASIDIEDENLMYMYSNWESKQDIANLMRHPVFKEIQDKTKHMIDGPPKHYMYEPIKR